MDVFNPSKGRITFHIRIDDNKSGWEYADRFDINFELKQGMNHISIPTDSIRTNIHHRPLTLKNIKRMMVFIPNNSKRRELYIDNIRLENEEQHYMNASQISEHSTQLNLTAAPQSSNIGVTLHAAPRNTLGTQATPMTL